MLSQPKQCQTDGAVDEVHCCDTSRSLRILIGWHSKVTSSEQGCKPALVKRLLYRSDVSIQLPTELACLTRILTHLRENRLSVKWSYMERPDIALLQSQKTILTQCARWYLSVPQCYILEEWNFMKKKICFQDFYINRGKWAKVMHEPLQITTGRIADNLLKSSVLWYISWWVCEARNSIVTCLVYFRASTEISGIC